MGTRITLGACALAVGACMEPTDEVQVATSTLQQALTPQEQHGRDVWLESTFGGETFFSLVLPNPPFDLTLGLDLALTTPRAERFTRWGLINDPDCTDGDASTGFLDRCTDPRSAGVVGVRKIVNPLPAGPRILFGITCASCHAGLDAANPPANPNRPRWDNIDLTIGNQHLQVGKIFAAHLGTHDPRYHVFRSWPPGTVDTTVLENDHINNPGMITPIFNGFDRPFFELHRNGVTIEVHRNGQGGEDDVGCELAALRVYFNIGMCARECMVGHLANGPGGTQTPIDLEQCRRDCPEYAAAEQQVGDLCAFLGTTHAPILPSSYIDRSVVARGRHVFQSACASCHSNGEIPPYDVFSDDELRTATGLGINRCRSLTTNWQDGHIWAAFASDEHKAFGTGFYRDLPLRGAWATAPFLHNNSIGAFSGDPTIAGRLAAYDDAMDELLSPWRRDLLGSIARTTDSITLSTLVGNITLPAGFPVALYANLDPANPAHNLCPDLLENTGHYFGVWLSPSDKYALKEFLKTR